MTITPSRHPPSPSPCDAAIPPALATRRRQRPSALPSAGKSRRIEYHITKPIAPTATKTSPAGHSTVVLSGTDKSDQAAAANSPQTDTSVAANSPALSSFQAFRTPASVHPLTPVTGRRPKTLKVSGRSHRVLRARQKRSDQEEIGKDHHRGALGSLSGLQA